jgi:hypothetical protein
MSFWCIELHFQDSGLGTRKQNMGEVILQIKFETKSRFEITID